MNVKFKIDFGKIGLNQAILFLLFLPFIYSFGQNYLLPFREFIALNRSTKKDFNRVQITPTAKMISFLQNLAVLPIVEKQKTLIFIPQSNQLYWGLKQRCDAIPFIVPAITGMAMLDGVPVESCQAKNYGYKLYHLRKESQSEIDKTREVLCKKANNRGFSQIIVIDSDDRQNIIRSDFSCP
jgi:hypothetical protein